jgi:hypothetical protein
VLAVCPHVVTSGSLRAGVTAFWVEECLVHSSLFALDTSPLFVPRKVRAAAEAL